MILLQRKVYTGSARAGLGAGREALNLAPRRRRLSRGPRPRTPLLALLSPILSGLSRLRCTALYLASGRVDGAAAPRWARGRSRGAGEPRRQWGALAGGRRAIQRSANEAKALLEELA